MTRLFNCFVAAVFALVAFGSKAFAAAPGGLTPIRIEVPSNKNLQYITLWVALGAGYFQQEGLEPKILVAPARGQGGGQGDGGHRAGRTAGEMLFQGQADVSLLPPPMFLGMIAENKPVVLFASLLANEPINLIVRKDVAEARKISAHTSLRERLQAIRGLKVGLSGEVSPRLRAVYASVGLDADKDLQFVVVPGPGQVQAFADGKVDVLFAHTPYLETVLVQYGGALLVETSGGEVPVLADGQVHALATTRGMAAAKPELMVSVTRAIYRAQRLIHGNRKATVDALITSGAAGPDRPMIEAIVSVYAPAVPQSPRISLQGIERDAELYPAHPRAPDFTRVKAADFVAAQFAEEAMKAAP